MDRELQEIFRRLDDLERALAGKADANPFGQATTKFRNKKQGTPPRIRDLELTNGIGTITAKWGFPSMGDLQRFEIQVATERTFRNPTQTAATLNTSFTWNDLDTDTTWYVRVRAVNQVGAEGPWSAVANNTTGLASTHDLNVEAATAIASVKKSGGFYPSFWNPGGLGLSQAYDVARMNVTFEEAADVEVAASWQFYLNIRDLDTASVRLFMDNTLYGRSEHKQGTQDQNLTLSGTTQASIANVPAGTHQFKVQFGISDTNGDGETSSITPDEIELQVFRSKR